MRANIIDPYWRLMRCHRPIGTLLLLWPTLIALWIAGLGRPSLKNSIIFILGVVITRAAGCVINDIADRKWDGLVARTQDRPLATGEISVKAALILFVSLMLIAFVLVLQTNLLTISMSFVAVILATTYPFMKRYTHLPQVVLGLAFAWAVPMAFTAEVNQVPMVAWVLFFATVCLTVAYDTLYAKVDKVDDLKVGIKSTAILFGQYDKIWIALFQGFALTGFAIGGYLANLAWPYYVAIGGALILLVHQYFITRDDQSFFAAFLNHQWVGLMIFVGTVGSYGLVTG